MPKIPDRSSPLVLGFDPGKNGGIAVIHDGEMEAFPMPGTDRDLWELLRKNTHWTNEFNLKFAMVEWINPAYPGCAKSSNSKLFGSFRVIQMVLTTLEIPFDVVMPAKWQAGLGIKPRGKGESDTDWKNRLKQKAQQLFPSNAKEITLKTADAILIAEYARRTRY